MKNFETFLKKEKVFLIILFISILIMAVFIFKLFVPSDSKSLSGLPADFPEIPIYPKANLVSTQADPAEGALYIGVRYGATWKIKSDLPIVAKWYTKKLKSEGWLIDTMSANQDVDDVQLVTLHNKDYALNMSFTKSKDSDYTYIISEFATNYLEYCNINFGKPCDEQK